ncbi:MAG TPA: selenium metabolism-associated LysR family transcriptional regulator [Bacillota bacterium]|nr:selenium metabolism-associated LysR family transcriptional regulator [Bacillota bacterium]
MNIKQFEALVKVAETGSFTKAAKLMFLTQPAISFQIRAMEEQLGIQLLERKDKAVVLTEPGKFVYREAKAVLSSFNHIIDHVAQFKGLKKGTLILGASTIPGEYLLPQYLGEFKQLYPGIDFRMEISSTRQIINKVLERQIHLGVVGAVESNPALEFEPLFQDEVVAICATDHPLAAKSQVSLEELAEENLLFREAGSGTRTVVEAKFTQEGINPENLKIVMELGSTRAIITGVQGNLGVGIVSQLAASEALRLNLVKKLELPGPDMHRNLYLITNKASIAPPLQKAFIDFIITKKEI